MDIHKTQSQSEIMAQIGRFQSGNQNNSGVRISLSVCEKHPIWSVEYSIFLSNIPYLLLSEMIMANYSSIKELAQEWIQHPKNMGK